MCANYLASERRALWDDFQLELNLEWPREAWPGSMAPIIRRDRDSGANTAELASFGLIPRWSRDRKIARRTYNARSETVAEKPSFRAPWRGARLCLVPMQAFYEPSWETGKAVRHRISVKGVENFCAGGIWERWIDRNTREPVTSFSLLTLNASDHPVMARFHSVEDAKRSIYIVSPTEYDAWLTATNELARVMVELPAADLLEAVAAPLPPRRRGAILATAPRA